MFGLIPGAMALLRAMRCGELFGITRNMRMNFILWVNRKKSLLSMAATRQADSILCNTTPPQRAVVFLTPIYYIRYYYLHETSYAYEYVYNFTLGEAPDAD